MNGALNTYRTVGLHGGVEAASPHKLIAMLLDGACTQIATARGHMERGDAGARGECISRAISMVDGLRVSLDREAGGEIAASLDALYDYINRRLLAANVNSQPAILDEVTVLLGEIRMAWDALPGEVRDAG